MPNVSFFYNLFLDFKNWFQVIFSHFRFFNSFKFKIENVLYIELFVQGDDKI